MSASATMPNPPPPRTLSCLVVEDQTMFLQLLVGMLRTLSGIDVRTTARTVAEGIAAVRVQAFDLLILDLRLPDGDGLEVFRAAVDANPEIDCVILSSAAGEFACPQGLLANLRALVDKTLAYEHLQTAIGSVLRARGIAARSAEEGCRDVREVLRPREFDVFRLIGRGLKTVEISRQLGISKNTVETHRKSIAAKLGASGAELVRLATLHNQTSLTD